MGDKNFKCISLVTAKPHFSGQLVSIDTAQKMKFFIKDFFSKCDQNRSFTGEILNGKFHFLWSESSISQQNSKRLNFLYKFHAVCDNSFLLKRAVFLTIFRHT